MAPEVAERLRHRKAILQVPVPVRMNHEACRKPFREDPAQHMAKLEKTRK